MPQADATIVNEETANRSRSLPDTGGIHSKVAARELTKIYSFAKTPVVALQDIDLEIAAGEFVCIIGESGCGKSTLLQIVAGFDSPTHGQILLDGETFRGPSHQRGVVFQEASLLPWLTVERNISLGLDIQGLSRGQRETITRCIQVMGLKGFERHRPAQLSGGMAQRVAIARALVNNPEILLLDEPFGALDAFTRMRLQDELLRLWMQERFTAIFVTHDIDEAVYLATRVVMMTPRPGEIARIFNVPLRRPRDRTSPEFIRLRGMIGKEFMSLAEQR